MAAANDDYPQIVPLTAVALGSIPNLVFPATPGTSWKLTSLQALLLPALWWGSAVSNTSNPLVSVNALAGASHRTTAGTWRAFIQGGGAAVSLEPVVYDAGVGVARWNGFLNMPAVNTSDEMSMVGKAVGAVASALSIGYLSAWGAGDLLQVETEGYTIAGPVTQDGQILRVWDGASGTNLMAEYLLATPGGVLATFSQDMELIGSIGSALTVDFDGAVATPSLGTSGSLATASGSQPSQESILAVALRV